MSTVAERLAEARRLAFAGRRAELERFAALLQAGASPAVLYLHGVGGVGKTSLLQRFAALATEAGRRTVWVEARDLGGSAAECTAAMALALGRPRTQPLPEVLGGMTGGVLFLDSVEELGPGERWLREEVLPALAGDAIAVLAGRDAPTLPWRTDPGWQTLVRAVRLDNLDDADAAALLRLRGVPAGEYERIIACARGHPLALAMAADVCDRTGGRFTVPAGREILTTLAGTLVGTVTDPARRAALEASAQVRVVTEPVLTALLDRPDTHNLFDWLAGLSVMAQAGRGLFPHDMAREVLDAESRWRHPEQHLAVRHRARQFYLRQFETADPSHQQVVLRDLAFLHRDQPVLAAMLAPLTPAATGDLHIGPATAGELPALRAMVADHEGPGSARLFDHWCVAQPESVHAVRESDGTPVGLQVPLRLDAATPDQRAVDPAAASAWELLGRTRPPARGEEILYVRFWLDRDRYQQPSPVQLQLTLHLVQYALTTPRLAVHLLAVAAPGDWADTCAYADMARMPEADFIVDGHRYGVFGHDWRARPPAAWLALLARQTSAGAGQVTTAAAPMARPVPERAVFAVAVREALRDLQRPDRLATGALAASRLVRKRLGGAPPDPDAAARCIRDAVREAAATMAESVRDRAAYRALHHTYLQPAGTQAAAADLLGLPSSTYRRHLSTGIGRLADLLWRLECD